MKILWIVNAVLNKLSEHMWGKPSNGVWMDALLNDFQGKEGYEIVVATTMKIGKPVRYQDENITYYALPDQPPLLYNENKEKNRAYWRNLLADEKPDLIQVWGTEFTHGLCALREAKNIPSVIYMQGYLGSIARYYRAGIPYEDLKRAVTCRDILKHDSIFRQQKKYEKNAKKEEEMLRLSGRIISENEWCNANIRAVVPDIKIFSCPLSINGVFENYKWDLHNVEKHAIICTASGYTIKGLHILLRALSLVKQKYPDVKLYIPGSKVISDGSFQGLLRKRGYAKYIEKLIHSLNIQDHIVWMGNVPQKALAQQYSKSHVFVMCSAIENHSSSLKEAMMVGVPSITTAVGGIPEYVTHKENGLLYRFEEYPVLANYICDVFESNELAQELSKNARETSSILHNGATVFDRITKIYTGILNGE